MGTLFRHEFHPSILREYDIRGIVGHTLNENDAQALGVVFASLLREEGPASVVIGHDGRLTSPALEHALVTGLLMGGASVRRIGCCPTPQLYHASWHHKADGAIMVTGSHNPLDYNGFKIVRANRPVFGQMLSDFSATLRVGVSLAHANEGRAENSFILDDYVAALRSGLRPEGRPLKVVWDNSHSSAGNVLKALLPSLPGHHIVLNGDIDGLFPAHHPDPSLPEAMTQLQAAVQLHRADLGVAFDGDADRLGVVDECGGVIPADQLSLLVAKALLDEAAGETILGDVKMSRVFFEGVAQAGGVGIMCPSGHSHVKNALRETGGVFAGEMSGHFFFADRWPGFDDGIYAALRVIDVLSRQLKPLSSLVGALPKAVSTPEIRFECPDEQKFGIVETVIGLCRDRKSRITLIDGIRVDEAAGWWLLRASNTQPALVARAEGSDKAACRAMLAIVAGLLAEAGIAVPDSVRSTDADMSEHVASPEEL